MTITFKNTSGIQPIRDLILIKAEEEVKSKDSVIILPPGAEQKELLAQTFGTVIAMGPTCYSYEKVQYGVEMGIEPGARVQFAKYQGIVVTGEDSQEYRLIRDDDIMALVTEKVTKKVEG
jgi:co-chaperonin GroES (HSP10)